MTRSGCRTDADGPVGIHGSTRRCRTPTCHGCRWLSRTELRFVRRPGAVRHALIQVIGVVLPVRRVCRGARPFTLTPGCAGPAGHRRQRARPASWCGPLSMATHEHDDQDRRFKTACHRHGIHAQTAAAGRNRRGTRGAAGVYGLEFIAAGFNPIGDLIGRTQALQKRRLQSLAIQPEPRTELQKPPPRKRERSASSAQTGPPAMFC